MSDTWPYPDKQWPGEVTDACTVVGDVERWVADEYESGMAAVEYRRKAARARGMLRMETYGRGGGVAIIFTEGRV